MESVHCSLQVQAYLLHQEYLLTEQQKYWIVYILLSIQDAIWNNYLTDWGTRGKFLEDPLAWWNTFWLRTHEKPEFLHAKPNVGHHAIGHITQRCNTRIITQNIDGLHLLTLNNPNRLIEIHGRLGLYKCIQVCRRFCLIC